MPMHMLFFPSMIRYSSMDDLGEFDRSISSFLEIGIHGGIHTGLCAAGMASTAIVRMSRQDDIDFQLLVKIQFTRLN